MVSTVMLNMRGILTVMVEVRPTAIVAVEVKVDAAMKVVASRRRILNREDEEVHLACRKNF